MILNSQQKAAIEYVAGPLLVLAGAGSGKTRVITQKVVYLLEQLRVDAKQICAITFTNKAAQEMNHRLSLAVPAKKKGLTVCTFHTLGLQFIKKEVKHLGLPKRFSLLDEEDSRQILKGVLPQSIAVDRESVANIVSQISLWKNAMLSYEQLSSMYPQQIDLVGYYEKYQSMLNACQAVDFDDLIVLPVKLMQDNYEVRQRWQQRWRFIAVDEYQDTNVAQYQLIKCLLGPVTNLCVVGDDDQSIYSWRGANPENLKQLAADFNNLKVIKLEQNYRSTGHILQAANALIANNEHVFSKRLWSEHGPGDLLRVIEARDDVHEAEQVIMDLTSHKYRFAKDWGEYAILYRGNHQSRHLERILRQNHVPYKMSGGKSWFGRSEIKDMLAYLKLCCNIDDDSAFLRIINTPKRGIGEQTLRTLSVYAKGRGLPLFTCADHLALSGQLQANAKAELENFKKFILLWKNELQQDTWPHKLHAFFAAIGFEAYWHEEGDNPVQAQKKVERTHELLDWIMRLHDKKPAMGLADALHKLLLIDLLAQDEDNEGAVQLMTLHAAKGLEFPHVYLIGMEEGLLPHQHSIETNQLAEERRLAYVGITRAQRSIVFSCCQKRKRGGEWIVSTPSRFLAELPEDLLVWQKNAKADPAYAKSIAREHLSGLKELLGI